MTTSPKEAAAIEVEAARAASGAQSVRRAMTLLRLVACGQEAGVRLSDLSAMSGLSRPTVHRLLKVLVQETAVEQDPQTRRYRIGPELSMLGLARASRIPIRTIAEPYLRALAEQVGDAVFLSVRHGADSVCVGRVLGGHEIQVLSIDVGVRRPLGASVSGIILLSGMSPAEVDRHVGSNATRLEIAGVDIAALGRKVRDARRAGHTYAEQGVMMGSSALAVPIRDPQRSVVAAISIAALGKRLDAARVPRVLACMTEHADMVTRRLAELEQSKAPPRAGPAAGRALTNDRRATVKASRTRDA